jgi:hypothetical protein
LLSLSRSSLFSNPSFFASSWTRSFTMNGPDLSSTKGTGKTGTLLPHAFWTFSGSPARGHSWTPSPGARRRKDFPRNRRVRRPP